MRKGIKVLAGITAFILIGGILWFANGLLGNPISKIIAEHKAIDYIGENYPHIELELSPATYNFKEGRYNVYAKSPTSIDTHFTVSISSSGKIGYDSYENNVLEKWNTFDRINNSYRQSVEAVFDKTDFPYKSDIDFGNLELMDKNKPFGPAYGITIEALELDKDYDITALGKEAGHIVFYTEDEEVSSKRVAEILLDIKNILDKEKVTFYAIDFVLEKPRLEEEKPNPNRVEIRVNDFLYSDIYEKDLELRIIESAKALQDYYDKEDAKKAEFEEALKP